MLEPCQARTAKQPVKKPVGWISMTEIVAAGALREKANLDFQGRSYPFQLGGGATGDGGASDAEVSGEIYGLKSISDFARLYTQSNVGSVWSDRTRTICSSATERG
jgi:hypothetical protein